MASIPKYLIDKANIRFRKLTKTLESKLNGKFPADIISKEQKIKWLINTTLRKYMSLTNDITENGLLLNKNISRVYIKNLVKRKKVHKKYKILKLKHESLGKMITFGYLPKTRETLPYYDVMPLVIPIELYEDGFAGLNLHYLPPRLRIFLLDKFQNFKIGKEDLTRFKILWKTLKSIKSLKLGKVIFKRYLYKQTLTQMVVIPEYDWYILPVLPSVKFVGKNDNGVWRDSIKASRK